MNVLIPSAESDLWFHGYTVTVPTLVSAFILKGCKQAVTSVKDFDVAMKFSR